MMGLAFGIDARVYLLFKIGRPDLRLHLCGSRGSPKSERSYNNV
jgi:hypothetical protein